MPAVPFVPFATGMQVNTRYLLDGENVEMVLGFDYASVGFAAAAPLVFNVLDGVWWDTVRYQLSDAIVSRETYMIDLVSQYAGSRTFPAFTNPAGVIVGEPVPNNVAFCVTHRTALRGKSFRGRTYIPGLSNAAVNTNTVLAVSGDAIVDGFNAMRTALFTDGINFCILSRRFGKAWRAAGQATPVEVSLVRDYFVDSQRGRGRGR